MNERIELVSDTAVRVQPKSGCGFLVEYRATRSGCVVEWLSGDFASCSWDTDAAAAVAELLTCWRETGSFAALSDTSVVPYTGKRMRDKGGRVVVAMKCHNGGWWVQLEEGGPMYRTGIRPLVTPEPPKPKLRPYTVEEFVAASKGLERKLASPSGTPREIFSVRKYAVVVGYVDQREVNFFELRNYTWADDGSPCGVEE